MRVLDRWLAKLGLRFADESAERQFPVWLTDQWFGQTRWVLLAAAVSWLAFYALDVYIEPDAPDGLVASRLIGGAAGLALTCVLFFDRKWSWIRRRWEVIVVVAATPLGVAMATMLISAPQYGTRTMAGVAICAFGATTLFGLRTTYAFAIAGVLVVPYSVAMFTSDLPEADKVLWMFWLATTWPFSTTSAYLIERARRSAFLEQRKSDRLLHNVLPTDIAARLRGGEGRIAENHDDVTVLFADLVGFTALTQRLDPPALVALLDRLFLQFDQSAETHGLEKIKTIGDSYMAAAGVPATRDGHTQAAAAMAFDMLRIVRELGEDLDLRIGIHSGPVVAGVIGKQRLQFDLWGETVNVASRLESHGVVGAIHVSEAVRNRLNGQYPIESRGRVALKGVGELETYLLRPPDTAGRPG